MVLKNITILGSGVMGHGIAQVSATAGYNVVLRDIKQEFLDEAKKNAEMVIEVVPEIMDLKKKVYAELDKAAAPEVIFASNTSTLPITEIANTTGMDVNGIVDSRSIYPYSYEASFVICDAMTEKIMFSNCTIKEGGN